jgi:predicted metal-dependent peptidase
MSILKGKKKDEVSEKGDELSPILQAVKERTLPYSQEEIDIVEEKIYQARSNFLMRQPFFGIMAMNLELVDASKWLVTAATDGKHFYYNVGFFLLLEPEEIQFVYGHEILHVAYDHFGRAIATVNDYEHYADNDMTFDEKIRLHAKLANIAADYCVNRDLVTCKVGTLIRKEVIQLFYDKKYDDMSMEEVYKDLLKDPNAGQKGTTLDDHSVGTGIQQEGNEKRKANPDGQEGGEGQCDGGDKANGGADFKPRDLTAEEREEIMRDFKDRMINAYDQHKDNEEARRSTNGSDAGSMPADLERLIERMRRPEINWRQYIRTRITSLFRESDDWSRPSRRSFDGEFIMPGFRQVEKVDIHIAIDCSGSIGEVEMADFLSEISGIAQQYKKDFTLRVWTFDGKVYPQSLKEYTPANIRSLPKYEFFGGGGTSFLANWAFMREKRIKPKLFIMFTDGYTGDGFGVPNYCDTIYVVNTEVIVPKEYGVTIRYKPRNQQAY